MRRRTGGTVHDPKVWTPDIAKQRFHVATDTEVFAITGPLIPYETDASGRVISLQINPAIAARRRE